MTSADRSRLPQAKTIRLVLLRACRSVLLLCRLFQTEFVDLLVPVGAGSYSSRLQAGPRGIGGKS
jgi:hypothetical protein